MDYTDSGFRAGFRRGLRVAWDAMCFRPLRFEPWPAPPMPSLREHLESYGGIGKSAVEVRGMVDEALKEIGKHSVHELEQKYFLDADGKVIGWGSIPGAIRWLRDLRDYCARHPDYKIIVF
ncbi:MAG: hypothetical protein ACLVG8_01480 [Bifidobacterium longum]